MKQNKYLVIWAGPQKNHFWNNFHVADSETQLKNVLKHAAKEFNCTVKRIFEIKKEISIPLLDA